MRVLLWYWGNRGGGAHYTSALAEAFTRRSDVAVFVSCSSELENLERLRTAVPAAKVTALRASMPVGALKLAPDLRSEVARRKIDVVLHSMVNPLTPVGLRALGSNRRRLAPVVTVIHDAVPHPGDEHRMMDFAVRSAIRRSDGLIASSTAVADEIARRYSRTAEVVALGPHLTMPDLWDPDGPVVFFGRIRAYKGLDLLAEAWKSVQGTGVKLKLVGEVQSEVKGLAELVECGASLENRWVPDSDIEASLRGARLIVLPYREASQSGVLTIAAAARIPVLVTQVGGLSEQVGDGGIVVAPTVDDIARGLRQLLGDSQRLAQIHRALVSRSTDDVVWDGLSESLVGILRSYVR